jgi:very-short-patch-repair endonuclease
MGSQADIGKVIASWQTKLLQLDRRNSLLYFRGQRSSVGIVEMSPDELLDRLQRSRIGLKFPYAEPRRGAARLSETDRDSGDGVIQGDLVTDIAPVPLQRNLLSLHRKDREWAEEQGVNVLFVALGFLHWIDVDGEAARSPLLLAPVDLERDSLRDPWRLKLEDEDLQINETLRYQLSTLGLDLPEFDHETPSSYLKEVAQRTYYKKGWKVEPALALATFPFAKMAMWEDLDQMRRTGTEHAVIRALASDQEALWPLRETVYRRFPEERELQAGGLDDLLPVKEQFTVLPADHSQLQAIELARGGGHLVIHGPPGTGKSQTIANIIATLLADGKRVLFVSEKTAALDVVKRRLEECELGCLCLDLHSHRARKASVYQQIRESLDAPRSSTDSFPLAKLEGHRERLNTVVRALHEKRSPLGLSIFEVHGRLAAVRTLRRVDFPIRSIEILSSETLSDVREATARIARRKTEFTEHRTSPWRSLRRTDSSVELADELRQLAAEMKNELSALQAIAHQEAQKLGLLAPENPGAVEVAGMVAGHMANCPGIPEIWLNRSALARLGNLAGNLDQMQSERRRLRQALEPFFGGEPPYLNFEDLKDQLSVPFRDEQPLRDSLGPEWGEQLCPLPGSCEQRLRDAIKRTRKLREASLLLTDTLLGKDRLDKLSRIRNLGERVRSALNVSIVPDSWFESAGFSTVRGKAQQAHYQLAELQEAERRLLKDFEESLLEQVSREMLVRYRTDYQSPWRIFKKSYRADQRILRGCLRQSRKLRVDEALTVVQSALRLCELRKNWESQCPTYASELGSRFLGRITNWEALAAEIRDVESWVQAWEWGLESAKRCFSAQGRTVVESLARDLEASLKEWEVDSLASRGADPALDLSIRQSALESGAEIVARLAQNTAPLLPHLHRFPKNWRELSDVLSQALQLRRIQAQEGGLTPGLRVDFGSYYEGPDSNWQKIQAAIQWTNSLLGLIGDRVPANLAMQCLKPHASEEYNEQEKCLLDAMKVYRARAAEFSEAFDPRQIGWIDWESPAFDSLTSWSTWIEDHADSALAWLEYVKAVKDLEGFLAPGAVDSLREATADALQVPDLVLRRIYAAWIDYSYRNDERLRFEPRDHEALREEFRKLDQRFVHANRARVRAQCFRKYPGNTGSAIEFGQQGILNRQLSLRRRQLPIRRLIQQVPLLLQALKPCFLMSPVAVSQYLSRSELATDQLTFDTVVFDEASQIFPQDAVPAIARAKQVIVVGDQKQLPPTSFFRSEMSEDEDEDAELSEDRLQGVESILDVMVGMKGTGVQPAYLGMHYRSRHEDLIRYSNHNFYEDRLLTFPSPDRAAGYLGLKDIYVPNGRYDAGASRTNRLEALAVVQRVFELLRCRPLNESVGVVALSRKQAELIEELIIAQRLEDSSLDSRFGETVAERFFVKNLENVQGDERDHIVLCIGYGPTVGSGNVPNRFGPINLEGGERRLNVAVTRARRSLTVIRSLRPEQITSESQGARFLRRFLEYAQDPARAFEQAVDVDPAAETESPFEEAVYRLLTERGYRISKQVGCFGYRIDLAIASEDGSRYDLGIECDGAAYHRAPAARDRDWLRQAVLEGLGWTIHRIWSTDWIRDPEAQIRSVEQALTIARAKAGKAAAAIQNPPDIGLVDPQEDLSERPVVDEKNENWFSKKTEEFQFAQYRPIELSENRRRVSIVDERMTTLIHLIERVVEAEGPVHIDMVIDRIRRHYGAGRAGSQIHGAITRAVDSGSRSGLFCWCRLGLGQDGQATSFLEMPRRLGRPEPRGPAEDGSTRPVEHIWSGEIEAGVIRVVETAFGASREDVVVAVARAFGYDRAGRRIQRAIGEAVERLIASGEVIETSTGLTSSDPSKPDNEGPFRSA